MTLLVGTEKSGSCSRQGPKIFLFCIASTAAVGPPSCSVGAVGTAHAQFLRMITHLRTVPRFRMNGATPPLPYMPSWRAQVHLYCYYYYHHRHWYSGSPAIESRFAEFFKWRHSVFTARQNWTLCRIIWGCKKLACGDDRLKGLFVQLFCKGCRVGSGQTDRAQASPRGFSVHWCRGYWHSLKEAIALLTCLSINECAL
jgi:hypothetical protein